MLPAARHVGLLFVLMLSGCTGSTYPARTEPVEAPPQVRHGDVSWTEEERAIIEESNRWVALHTGTREVHIVWNLAPDANVLSVSWAVIKGKAGGGMSVTGPGGNHSTTFSSIGNPLDAISAHEFGHLAGLDHNPDPHSFMYYAPLEREWTPTDEFYCVLSGVCK